MKRRSDGVADTAKMQDFMEMAKAFHGGGGGSKRRRRMAGKMVSCVQVAQRVQSSGLKEMKAANSESDEEEDDS